MAKDWCFEQNLVNCVWALAVIRLTLRRPTCTNTYQLPLFPLFRFTACEKPDVKILQFTTVKLQMFVSGTFKLFKIVIIPKNILGILVLEVSTGNNHDGQDERDS